MSIKKWSTRLTLLRSFVSETGSFVQSSDFDSGFVDSLGLSAWSGLGEQGAGGSFMNLLGRVAYVPTDTAIDFMNRDAIASLNACAIAAVNDGTFKSVEFTKGAKVPLNIGVAVPVSPSPIYRVLQILGGEFWGTTKEVLAEIDPEKFLIRQGLKVFGDGEGSELISKKEDDDPKPYNNIVELMAAFITTLYHRAGYQGLPAMVQESLIKGEENEQIELETALEFQLYHLKALDALMGQFPIKIKLTNEDTEEKTLEFPNVAETMAELMGMHITNRVAVTTITDVLLRTLAEVQKERITSHQALDFGKSIAQFIGFKGNYIERKMKILTSPQETKLNDFLQPSEQFYMGFNEEDEFSLMEFINKIHVDVATILAAVTSKVNPEKLEEDLFGGLIESFREQNREWDEIINRYRNPRAGDEIMHPEAENTTLEIIDRSNTEPPQIN